MLQLKALGRLGAIILAIIALGPSVVWAQEPAPVELTEDLLSGVEVSGYWRHAEEAGSEWRLTLRDPSGELLSLDSVDVEYLAGGPDRPGPEGSAPAPRRSLVLDISRPRSIEGPDTVLMRAGYRPGPEPGTGVRPAAFGIAGRRPAERQPRPGEPRLRGWRAGHAAVLA